MAYANDMPQRSLLVVPSDTNTIHAAGLRVANKSANWATIAVKLLNLSPGSVAGDATVTYDVPPNAVDYIPGQFKLVLATGTTAGLVIHSFSDIRVF